MVSSDRERKKELLCGGMEKCMSEVIVVTSGKGGVGKTTTSANVGTGLAKLSQGHTVGRKHGILCIYAVYGISMVSVCV